ncbi:secretin N-terminal domain-containing protein [Verrucomicrobiales bacterium BCK34]|nr:secretin N-terminal domain-containing protein [Verrucomicrobiales bacterium BCK34]
MMKYREIGTVTVAAIFSISALLILKRTEEPIVAEPRSPGVSESISFTDNAPLVEFPAPTAEPAEEGGIANSKLFKLIKESVPNPVDMENGVEQKSPLETLAAEAASLGEGPMDATKIKGLGAKALGVVSELSEEGGEGEEGGGGGLLSQLTSVAKEALADPDGVTGGANGKSPKGGKSTGGSTTRVVTETEVDESQSLIEETPTGFWLREARLNDVFQHLAQLGDLQYFHNNDIDGPGFVVTGQLMNDDPVKQMEELALMYGITIHRKGNTVYALNAAQLSQLPTEPFRYQLKYLRPSDIETIKLILQPFLTPGSGIIEYESKTNTLIVMDNERKLDALSMFLEQIDKPKQQIAIETRILRITSKARNRIGVDWSGILGDAGLSFSGESSLNALFNLPEIDTVTQVLTSTGGTLGVVDNAGNSFETTRGTESNNADLVLNPLQLSAVLRALNAGGLAQQESSPTLITEDNEEGLIAIIDRIPIITSTVSETDAGQNITDEVRYVIDENDPVGDPATTREVGVSVSVTPTILPDDTIRMALRPRSAQVVDYVESQSGNLYPRVNESTVTTTARVPNGHSLLIGGFYEEIESDETNKVPLLGDIPAVNLLFKSVDKVKEHTSLVFIVTPKLYRPEISLSNDAMSHEIHESHVLPTNHAYPDRKHPGHSYQSDLKNTVDNAFNKYEPDAPTNLLHPAHPYNQPQSMPVHGKTQDYQEEPRFAENPSVRVRPANDSKQKGGLLGKLFKGNRSRTSR